MTTRKPAEASWEFLYSAIVSQISVTTVLLRETVWPKSDTGVSARLQIETRQPIAYYSEPLNKPPQSRCRGDHHKWCINWGLSCGGPCQFTPHFTHGVGFSPFMLLILLLLPAEHLPRSEKHVANALYCRSSEVLQLKQTMTDDYRALSRSAEVMYTRSVKLNRLNELHLHLLRTVRPHGSLTGILEN